MEQNQNTKISGKVNSQTESHLYLAARVDTMDLGSAADQVVEQNAKIALGEFLQNKDTQRVTSIEEELQMLEANLQSVDQLVQKNSFLMREVKYLMKL